MKHSVTAVIINDKKQVLAVSRSYDHSDFGLPGGKVEEGETPEEAIIREMKEETGLNVKVDIQVLSMSMFGYMGHTYLIKDYSGSIGTTENHIVKWVDYKVIEQGCFGEWNKILSTSLRNLKLL